MFLICPLRFCLCFFYITYINIASVSWKKGRNRAAEVGVGIQRGALGLELSFRKFTRFSWSSSKKLQNHDRWCYKIFTSCHHGVSTPQRLRWVARWDRDMETWRHGNCNVKQLSQLSGSPREKIGCLRCRVQHSDKHFWTTKKKHEKTWNIICFTVLQMFFGSWESRCKLVQEQQSLLPPLLVSRSFVLISDFKNQSMHAIHAIHAIYRIPGSCLAAPKNSVSLVHLL